MRWTFWLNMLRCKKYDSCVFENDDALLFTCLHKCERVCVGMGVYVWVVWLGGWVCNSAFF